MTQRMIFPVLFGIVGIAILLWLGFWQLQRLEWKEGILATINTRMQAEPVALDDLGPAPDITRHNYQSVVVEGDLTGREAHVLTGLKLRGAGYRILAEMAQPDGNILIDLGFVDEVDKNAARALGRVRVLGNLSWPDDYDPAFTPDPDLDKNIWFARHMPHLVDAFDVKPVLVVARRVEIANGDGYVPFPGVDPLPVTANIPNDHREYAITWFSLALVWLGMTVFWLWRIRQQI